MIFSFRLNAGQLKRFKTSGSEGRARYIKGYNSSFLSVAAARAEISSDAAACATTSDASCRSTRKNKNYFIVSRIE